MPQNSETYYVQKNNSSIIEEIRRKVKINNIIKYIIDRKDGIQFVTANQFYNIPIGYRMMKIK
jgi:hypothetical protein